MGIYIFFFIFLLLGLFPQPYKKSVGYILFVSFFLFIIIGFRDISVGIDTVSYVEDYTYYCHLSWNNLVQDALTTKKEPVYWLITGVLSRISDNYTLYLSFWGLFPVVALYYLFKRELKSKMDIAIAVIVLFILGIMAFFVAGIRQTSAMSVVIVSYQYLKRLEDVKLYQYFKNADFYKFLLLVAFAFCLHNSSIIFILVLLFKDFKVRWWYILIPVVLFFIGTNVDAGELNLIAQMVFDDQYKQYGTSYESSLSNAGFFMQLILFIICFFQKDNLIKQDKSNQALFNFAIAGLGFQSMVGIIAEMYRLSFYFGMFNMLLVPRALNMYKKDLKIQFAHFAFIVGTMVYLFFLSSASLTEYKFVF